MFFLQLPGKFYQLVFHANWQPIRFIVGLVWLAEALMQYGFALNKGMIVLGQWLYYCGMPISIAFGFLYLLFVFGDEELLTEKRKYWLEFVACLLWIWFWYVDWYCYSNNLIRMDVAAWDNHVIDNSVVLFSIACSFLNSIGFSVYYRRTQGES
jgi:hypothetical protein